MKYCRLEFKSNDPSNFQECSKIFEYKAIFFKMLWPLSLSEAGRAFSLNLFLRAMESARPIISRYLEEGIHCCRCVVALHPG